MITNDDLSAIPMNRFGIKTIAVAPHLSLVEARAKFIKDPDWTWCDGKGKKFMHRMLRQKLLLEDAYFEEHIDQAINSNQRWNDFIDDCVIFAVLDEVITSNPMILLHPSCSVAINHPQMPPFNKKLTLVEGISSLN